MAQQAAESAAQFLPERITLGRLREAASGCRGCELYRYATQTVFGEGKAGARIMVVGEVPGDQEDRRGRPFVGPAGRLLDRALTAADIPRSQVYITNAVKHFKWEPRGKRRLHKKPLAREISACRPWLVAEAGVIKPEAIVCLGGTAARALFDRVVRVRDYQGRLTPTPLCKATLVTTHPSAILRIPDGAARHAAFEQLVEDLETVRHVL